MSTRPANDVSDLALQGCMLRLATLTYLQTGLGDIYQVARLDNFSKPIHGLGFTLLNSELDSPVMFGLRFSRRTFHESRVSPEISRALPATPASGLEPWRLGGWQSVWQSCCTMLFSVTATVSRQENCITMYHINQIPNPILTNI